MDIKINVTDSIIDQFSEQLNIPIIENKLELPHQLGKGQIELLNFPNQIEFYHFQFNLNEVFSIQSTNPINSEWLLFNINLSTAAVQKTVNNQKINFQKFSPSGILFYTADTSVSSESPKNIDFEIALVRINKQFFRAFQSDQIFNLQNSENAIIYEDLDYDMENNLKGVIHSKNNKIKANAFLMQFLADIITKLKGRDLPKNYEHLHPADIKGLFIAASHLRNPIASSIPTITDLAVIAGMGNTKFKLTFKQVFGETPMQYHQKIKFNYAKKELQNKRKTVSDLSYELGYSHPSKFTNAFKKIFGIVPSSIK